MARPQRMLGVAAVLVVGAAVTSSCATEPPEKIYDCSDTGQNELYDRRIAPLLEEDRPKSCNQCHLSGLDFASFVRDTPCDTMACMVERGLVDLGAPDSSLILQWIDRAVPDSAGITDQVLAEERLGFVEWIESTAQCGLCSDNPEPCGEIDKTTVGACGAEPEIDAAIASDPGDCSARTLESVFLDTFFLERARCYPCHFEVLGDEIPAPKWMAVGDCESANATTMRRVIENGYVNTADPLRSRWLLKPLSIEYGGIDHGGGAKIHGFEEPIYRGMAHWLTRYAACQDGG
jgi:hypothetical protein